MLASITSDPGVITMLMTVSSADCSTGSQAIGSIKAASSFAR